MLRTIPVQRPDFATIYSERNRMTIKPIERIERDLGVTPASSKRRKRNKTTTTKTFTESDYDELQPIVTKAVREFRRSITRVPTAVSHMDGEDLEQECWTAIVAGYKHEIRRTYSWAKKVCRNKLIDLMRRESAHVYSRHLEEDEDMTDDTPSPVDYAVAADMLKKYYAKLGEDAKVLLDAMMVYIESGECINVMDVSRRTGYSYKAVRGFLKTKLRPLARELAAGVER